MRTPVFKILFALTALALASCDEWNVRMDTQVMRDGSCIRTVTTDDDGCLTEDEGWEVLATKDSVDFFKKNGRGYERFSCFADIWKTLKVRGNS